MEENENSSFASLPEEEKKKKSKVGRIILWILLGMLIALILLAVGFGIHTYIKLKGMNEGAAPFEPVENMPSGYSEIVTPNVTLVPVLSPDDIDITVDYDIDIDPIESTDDPIFVTNPKDENIVNILMIGTDARGSERGRTDSMMLVSYNRATNEAKLISFLRDSWVYSPGRSGWNRLNTAYFYGGTGLLINTININFDLDIQYYMKVNFSSLERITDKLGGIDLELSEREVDYINNNGGELEDKGAGWYRLNGKQTLIHARNRKIGNGDWSRAKRQRQVMFAFLNRAMQEKSVGSLTSLVYSLMDDVETNLTPAQLISLAVDVVFGSELQLQNRSVPFEDTWEYAWEGRMAVIHVDLEKNAKLLNEYLYGEN